MSSWSLSENHQAWRWSWGPPMMIFFLKERSWSWTPQFTPDGFPNLWSSQKNRVGFQPSFQCLNSLIGLPPSLDGYIPRVRIQRKQTKRYRNAILCPLLKARFTYGFYVNIYNERFSKKFSYNKKHVPQHAFLFQSIKGVSNFFSNHEMLFYVQIASRTLKWSQYNPS